MTDCVQQHISQENVPLNEDFTATNYVKKWTMNNGLHYDEDRVEVYYNVHKCKAM